MINMIGCRFNQTYLCTNISAKQLLINRANLYMGKKQKKTPKIQKISIRDFPIAKTKSFAFNLNCFIKMLEQKYSNMTSRQFVTEVHAFVARIREKIKEKYLSVGMTRQRIRICKNCDGWSHNCTMLQCTLCEDYYHQSCLGQAITTFKETGLCDYCSNYKISQTDPSAYLSKFIVNRCFKCGLDRRDRQAFVHCLRCSSHFHKKCYGTSVVVCQCCKSQIDQEVKMKNNTRQSTLFQFGCSQTKKVKENIEIVNNSDHHFSNLKTNQLSSDFFKNEEETKPFPVKQLFCNLYPEMSEEEIEKYKENLLFAILSKNMNYTQNLMPMDCTLESNNEESLDFGLEHMTKLEYNIYQQYKRQPIGPFLFVFTVGMGYNVVADRDIKEKTFICQYIGEVVTLRRCIQLQSIIKNDSLMELRVGCNSEETLIIRPDKFTNMARFINGVNNAKSTSKANIGTVRKLARGIPTVILYTLQGIKKGESLLYDYNAGQTTCKYDTSSFL